MLQFAHRLRFAVEALEHLGVVPHRPGHHLDRHGAADPRINRPIDDAHPSPTDHVEHVVLADLFAVQSRHLDGSLATSDDESQPSARRDMNGETASLPGGTVQTMSVAGKSRGGMPVSTRSEHQVSPFSQSDAVETAFARF